MLDYTWTKSITIYTAIIPITASIDVIIKADLSLKLSVSSNSIRFDAGVGGLFKLRGEAALNALVYKIGVYAEGTLFQGSLNMSLIT